MSKNAQSPRRVIILGALSAVAEACARELAGEGAHLALFARNAERLEEVAADLRLRGAGQVQIFARDLAGEADCEGALREAGAALGGIDAVLVFYGILGDQARALSDWAEARHIIDVNFTSAAHWVLAAARLIEASPSPRAAILVISSVAGDRGRRGNFVYGAAKAGLSVLMQGLAHRFAALPAPRPRAVTIKLGFVDTPMTAAIEKKGPLWAKPEDVAPVILKALDRGPSIVYVPFIWRFIMLAVRLMPGFIFNRINL
ncbi:MAG: SDR family NAD(P)-dependent oxidoreductase [Alphaproteobacteria bacterium]|nr:SDR family NAD(P)-dependent oxidoreductase [Alphaproteobacteria bacterium]